MFVGKLLNSGGADPYVAVIKLDVTSDVLNPGTASSFTTTRLHYVYVDQYGSVKADSCDAMYNPATIRILGELPEGWLPQNLPTLGKAYDG
jgi:hypothetical protein